MDAPSLASTEELVTELQKRMNFRGVVIWQPDYNGVPDTKWRWHSMHCVAEIVCSEILQSLRPSIATEAPSEAPAEMAVLSEGQAQLPAEPAAFG